MKGRAVTISRGAILKSKATKVHYPTNRSVRAHWKGKAQPHCCTRQRGAARFNFEKTASPVGGVSHGDSEEGGAINNGIRRRDNLNDIVLRQLQSFHCLRRHLLVDPDVKLCLALRRGETSTETTER